ncbi:FkbM family methyltransferase [Novosphingobium sp. M1R2S20]|uniref:FkbM family methyltransferase n=1 Tax=Novosphingobium rhizovicinum TaxID=3228928 RepID=A0ABV3RAW0_9SPHN
MAAKVRGLGRVVGDRYAMMLFSLLRKRAEREPDFRGIVVPIDDLIGHNLIATGRFESTQIDAVYTLLANPTLAGRAQSGRFVDVGANIGLYSLAFSSHFLSTLAIEANPHTFLVLKANLALRHKDEVTAVCVGASNTTAEAEIHVPLNGNLGWATLNAAHHKIPTQSLPVIVRPLDDIIKENRGPRVELLKIDVEGHEPKVFEGASRTLNVDGPIVMFEVLDADAGERCSQILRDCGYSHFYTFRRDWPTGSNKFNRMWRGWRSGLPVLIEALRPGSMHKAPLVCAAKSPIA